MIAEPAGQTVAGTVLHGASGEAALPRHPLAGAKVVPATVVNSALNNPVAGAAQQGAKVVALPDMLAKGLTAISQQASVKGAPAYDQRQAIAGSTPPTAGSTPLTAGSTHSAAGLIPSTGGSAHTIAGSTNSTAVSILRPALDSDLSAAQRQALEGALSSGQWGQLEHLSTRLVGSMTSSDSRLLVNLARMLGMDFEALLARDQVEQANQGLKGMLLSLQKNGDLPESVRENSSQMAQQLEVLQLCRLRLAQDGVLFLPLPLDFLEQGYVLFEQQSPESASDDEAAGHLVSLNLTMQQLGVMQVNLLFEQQALFVRIKCADEEVATLVEGYWGELHEALQPFSIRSIQVTTGAEDPALVLLRRLQSDKNGQTPVLDARV